MKRFPRACRPVLIATVMLGLWLAPDVSGQDAVDLKPGDPAPVFEIKDDQGKTWKSSDHVGSKILVIYFYPADMTGGCTKQACSFRDDMGELASKDVEVVGVSGDSAANHRLFKKAYNLNFTLLADEKGAVAKKFGVPIKAGGSIKRTVDGKEITLTRGVTASRWTFVIDKQGKIAFKNTLVRAAEDSKNILGIIAKLRGEVDLKVGDPAPVIVAKGDDGKTWKSADRAGKKILVVYFYPADMTPGCTKQACGFRDDMKTIVGKDVEVVGVSGDSVGNHRLFKKAYTLNYTLLADEKGVIAKSFGVPIRKGGSIKRTIDGKEHTLTRGVTASRWTFVISRDGKIAYKNTKVNAAEDSKTILKVINELRKKAKPQ